MPFKSERQRRYLHMIHPELAERWEHEAKRRHQAAVQPKRKRRKAS